MDNLFDVFDEDTPTAQPSHDAKTKKSVSPDTVGKKRAANGAVKAANGSPVHVQSSSSAAPAEEQQSAKKPKLDETAEHKDGPGQKRRPAEIEPVVADVFETEQSREVQAAAGLQATKDQHAVVLSHQVRHQVSLPPDYSYVPISQHKSPEKPAREWPFKLDPFQAVSIASIERNESVLVSAHTSAGKTVVAEYAIAQCLKSNQRVVYTSPIKALSNQKYREFAAEFGDVGLMTGDTTLNPTASCLVMTTEILRSMLYRGSEIMREVSWVIFDEVHYMRDAARGVVWEETIILLPDKVRYVFLSATIPNAMQFAEWITTNHSQPCHVVYTDFRPTPLQHYLYPAGSDGIHLVVDEKGTFREENFQKAMSTIADRAGDDGSDPLAKRKGKGKDKRTNKGGRQDGPSDIYKIIKMIMMKNYNPVIVFSFSKRDCENHALKMSSLAFNDDVEKDLVQKVFDSALESLSEEDRSLPQIMNILPLLRRGIGIHHSGLLPILKETIEILFQEGLIKVLFATETFSIGLNMPAKTVVFTSVRKFDGKSQRWVTPSEFIQMSGRAGRRGLDERGIVIMMLDEKMEPEVAKEVVRGEQDKLNSAFYLGYNMILNLIRVEGISPEFMLERCFHQFQNTASVAGMEQELLQLEDARAKVVIEDEQNVKEYYDLRHRLDTYAQEMRQVITKPEHCKTFLQPGRMVKIKLGDHDFGWGTIVSYNVIKSNNFEKEAFKENPIQLEVLLLIADDSESAAQNRKGIDDLPPGIRPPQANDKARMEVVPVMLATCVEAFGIIRLFLPPDLRPLEARNTVRKHIEHLKTRFPDGISLLDPVENMNITDDSFKKLLRKLEMLEAKLLSNPLHEAPELPKLYSQYAAKMEIADKAKSVRKKISDASSVLQLDELKQRKRVLRRLGFTDDADVVKMKARVACEISTGDELVISELLFNGFFNELSPEHCAAALSCFIFEEKTKDAQPLKDEHQKLFREIQAQARVVAKVSQECKLPLSEAEYLETFKPELMNVVQHWCQGGTFSELTKMTDVYEGSLIRLFRRLEELLRQIGMAAKVMGNEELEKKFTEAYTKLRRDIVAAQSLYL